ncbi:ABC transporter ATP-binding protein [Halosimplex amylolyticum]|uniref:ABC transporter ATP-binding protein n=1 Tax=Halosimplex amylolyticum TaxID=3396616 RepID=UPI003F572B57
MTAIRTRNLTKRFGDVVAVDGLDLSVNEGEVFGFLGPNGAGKSTVINVLLDFVRPTEGSATVLGHDPQTDAGRIRRRTGVLPEGGALYGRLTGREHVEWVARANGVEADVDALLKRVGLSADAADRAVEGYSKGMAQRLAFGLALVGDPDLLILDEPSSGLDPTGMQDLREIVRAEADEGRTVFFSSHLLSEVEAVCDRIGIMNDGRLATTGTPEELRTDLDLGGSIRFDVARVPDDLALESVAGVETVETGDSSVAVTVSDPTAKIAVAVRLAERARVLDIVSEDASLEQLFNRYTSSGRTADPTPVPSTDPLVVEGER